MQIRFRWDGEEGGVVKADREKVLSADRIIAADFLIDVIYEAQKMYNEVLEKKNV